jgi:hypothetical protein
VEKRVGRATLDDGPKFQGPISDKLKQIESLNWTFLHINFYFIFLETTMSVSKGIGSN